MFVSRLIFGQLVIIGLLGFLAALELSAKGDVVPSEASDIGNDTSALETPGIEDKDDSNVTSSDVIPNMIRRAEEKMKQLGYDKIKSKLHVREDEALREAMFNLSAIFKPKPIIEKGKRRYKVRCRRKPDRVLRSLLGQAFNARYMSFAAPAIPVSEVYQEVTGLLEDDYPSDDPGPTSDEDLPFAVISGFRKDVYYSAYFSEDDKGQSNDYLSRSRRDTKFNKTLTIETPLNKTKSAKAPKPKRTPAPNNDPGVLWSCEYELRWTDLGPDHFPRYIREAYCVQKHCWFGHFECRAKAFTVKVLKRWGQSCQLDTDQYLNLIVSKAAEESDVTPVHDHDTMIADKEVDYEVPHELQEKWVWEEIGVNFCCECTNVKAKSFGKY